MSKPIKKGDIVVNPKTSRPVKVGGKTWIKLVKEGILEGNFEDPVVIAEGGATEEETKEKIDEINKQLEEDGKSDRILASKGKTGRNKGKIIKFQRKLKPLEVSSYTAKKTAEAVLNNIDEIAEADEEDVEALLRTLIVEELLRSKPAKKRKQTKFKKRNNDQYTTVKIDGESEYSESESESESEEEAR